VAKTRICLSKGITEWWSASNKRNIPRFNSSVFTIYVSNTTLGKSEYSYLQYHWCPIVLRVKEGSRISSSKYNNRSDGKAINKRITEGKSVQTISIV